MSYLLRMLSVSFLFIAFGCAHQINITPPLNPLDKEKVVTINKNVGYYISTEDRSKEVVTPGGGGDKVRYFPYKECEPALKKVLSNIFSEVHSLSSLNDKQFVTSNNISYIFEPKIDTDSASSSAFTWPPTSFTVSLDCKAIDINGKVIWQKKTKGLGEAAFSEFKHDHALAAKRAVLNAFKALQVEIITAGVF